MGRNTISEKQKERACGERVHARLSGSAMKLVVAGDLDPDTARCLVTGDIAITRSLAKKLERATNIPWRFWRQLQVDYEEGRT